MKTNRIFSLPSAIILSAILSPGLAQALPTSSTYDLVNDWSDTQNPNGAWSYNWDATPISVHQNFWWGQGGWGYNDLGDGAILKGSYPTGVPDPFTGTPLDPPHDWVPGDVMMHALSLPYGGGSTCVNVTWTSPANGTIDLSGRAWDGEIFADRDVAWSLLVGGQTIASRSSVIGLYRSDAGAQFSSNLIGNSSLTDIPVTQGEVVEFMVATDTYYGHFVGVQENIVLTVPEANSARLLVAGLVGLWSFRRFFPKAPSTQFRR
jgi:hypothetical protein